MLLSTFLQDLRLKPWFEKPAEDMDEKADLTQ
jgi:hypothetical protein